MKSLSLLALLFSTVCMAESEPPPMTLQADPLPTLKQEPGASEGQDSSEGEGSNDQQLEALATIADEENNQNARENEELAELPK